MVIDKGYGELLKLVKKMLPKDNELPATTYEAKKLVCPLGLEVQKIHACPNDCILYRGEYENLDACPNFKVPLFRCQWVKLSGGGVTKDEYGIYNS